MRAGKWWVYSGVFVSAEDLQTEGGPVPATSRCQKLLQGTSFTILLAAVSKSPSVLGSIDADKAGSVAGLAGVSWPNQNVEVTFSVSLGRFKPFTSEN